VLSILPFFQPFSEPGPMYGFVNQQMSPSYLISDLSTKEQFFLVSAEHKVNSRNICFSKKLLTLIMAFVE